MTGLPTVLWLLLALVGGTPSDDALASARGARIQGVVFDSLLGVPLAGAEVRVVETDATTTTDARGQFSIAGVAPGSYTLWVGHARLDSLGLNSLSSRTLVGPDSSPTVTMAVPSFETMWHTLCESPMPASGAPVIMFGNVVDVKSEGTVSGATVRAAWGTSSKVEATSDAEGRYALCGVPATGHLEIGVVDETNRALATAVAARGSRVVHRDLAYTTEIDLAVLASAADEDSTAVVEDASAGNSVVRVSVRDANGKAVGGARVQVAGRARADVADSAGRVVMTDAPIGTRLLTVSIVGYTPWTRVVQLGAADTVVAVAVMVKATNLAAVTVRDRRADLRLTELETRRKLGGYFFDSTAISKVSLIRQVINVPSVRIDVNKGSWLAWTTRPSLGKGPLSRCYMNVIVDGDPYTGDYSALESQKESVAFVEVYPRNGNAPQQFMPLNTGTCGVIFIWTKAYLGIKKK